MAKAKFKKGQWVVRVQGTPNEYDCAGIGDMRQVDESDCEYPYVTHKDKHGARDFIDKDEYRLATPEEVENMK